MPPHEQGNHEPDLYGFLNDMVPLIPYAPLPESGPNTMLALPYIPEIPTLMKQALNAPNLDQRCAMLSKVLQVWVDQVAGLISILQQITHW